jgi:hypothetical protein
MSLYEFRCRCKEKLSITKKRKSNNRSEGKPIKYISFDSLLFPGSEIPSTVKTFQIKYEKKLSSITKFVLNSFQRKYLYYAIDDILYLFKSNSTERDNLLAILYSPVLSIHNNLSINFFDIWIEEIYINEVPKVNRFLTTDSPNFERFNYITIKLRYKTGIPSKKQEVLW